LISHLRKLIASKNKKSYTVAVGKLNPAKLANFIEVECFVLVACPENTMVDSKVRFTSHGVSLSSDDASADESQWIQEFLRPIVTPFELELALTSKAWTGQYILDFGELLASSTFGQDEDNEEDEGNVEEEEGDEEAPVYSATTGKYRHPKKYYQNGVQGESSELSISSLMTDG